MLEIQVLSEESLSHVQGSLITQTSSPMEQNKETWKMERQEAVAKDPGMLEDW
jgi:hypothetical protein